MMTSFLFFLLLRGEVRLGAPSKEDVVVGGSSSSFVEAAGSTPREKAARIAKTPKGASLSIAP